MKKSYRFQECKGEPVWECKQITCGKFNIDAREEGFCQVPPHEDGDIYFLCVQKPCLDGGDVHIQVREKEFTVVFDTIGTTYRRIPAWADIEKLLEVVCRHSELYVDKLEVR